MAAALSACGHRASTADGTKADSTSVGESQDSIANADEPDVTVETIKYEKSDSTAEVSLLIQWPTEGSQPPTPAASSPLKYRSTRYDRS